MMTSVKPGQVLTASVAAIAVIGLLDFVTGIEARIFVLYFIPIGFMTWHLGRTMGVIAAVVSGFVWIVANLASLVTPITYAVWIWNFMVMQAAFVFVALLFANIRQTQLRLVELATRDPLTGLLNRRAMIEVLDREVRRSRRYRRGLSFVFIDIDGFKALNDSMGHEEGDNALKLVADVLARRVRSSDTPARLGGDEFVILLPETPAAAARRLVDSFHEQLRSAVAQRGYAISFSVGLVTYTESAPDSADHVIKEADKLMYHAKNTGKGKVVATSCE